ncbi:predicted protein [Nematostella vectensis]|uniref:NTR domain-containing protein n=1 Tax=Nematostella vectensis TaxID=45351 RepID=A7SBN2_NEMVE|nr:predicted protein [Nematostella vectensis]|eukprot:XP_001630935.1 predicted protein [Nematostella vectensis]
MKKSTRFIVVLVGLSLLLTRHCQARRKPKLNVFIDGKEVARFLYDIRSSLYLVRDSEVAAMLMKPLTNLVPPIQPNIRDIKFKFNSNGKPYEDDVAPRSPYEDDVGPRLPYEDDVGPRSVRTRLDSIISKMVWGPLHLALRRRCRATLRTTDFPQSSQKTSSSTLPIPRMCNKKCTKRHIFRRFCLSDYAIRARVDSEVHKNGHQQLRVRVSTRYKSGAVRITKRQLLELRGRELTCNCSQVLPSKVYLIIGKEDKHRRVLFVDGMVSALEWDVDGKKMARMIRKRRDRCPKRITP